MIPVIRVHSSAARHTLAGFTLVEIIVAVALFIILLGTLMGLYTAFTKNHRQEFAEQIVQQDIQNVFETMDREVRTGYGSSFGSSGSAFWLTNQNGECVEYKLDTSTSPGKIVRIVAPSGSTCDSSAFNGRIGETLTSSGTDVKKLLFSGVTAPTVNAPVGGATQGTLSGNQGSVTISLTACPTGVTGTQAGTCLDIETSEVSRQYAPAP